MPHPIYRLSVAQKPNTETSDGYFGATLFFINFIYVGGSIADWKFYCLSFFLWKYLPFQVCLLTRKFAQRGRPSAFRFSLNLHAGLAGCKLNPSPINCSFFPKNSAIFPRKQICNTPRWGNNAEKKMIGLNSWQCLNLKFFLVCSK